MDTRTRTEFVTAKSSSRRDSTPIRVRLMHGQDMQGVNYGPSYTAGLVSLAEPLKAVLTITHCFTTIASPLHSAGLGLEIIALSEQNGRWS